MSDKITVERATMQSALNALTGTDLGLHYAAIDALRAALASQPAEPVAWKCMNCGNTRDCEGVTRGDNWCNSCGICGQMKPLVYAAPAAVPSPEPEQELRTTVQRVAIAMQARITVRIEQIGVDVTSTFDCMPKRDVCYNCATELPEGCGGIFQDDGEHFRWSNP